jgi:hypothetical protein
MEVLCLPPNVTYEMSCSRGGVRAHLCVCLCGCGCVRVSKHTRVPPCVLVCVCVCALAAFAALTARSEVQGEALGAIIPHYSCAGGR